MRLLKFQTRYPTGQVEQLSVETERVLIGSGAHCEIRLPLDQARVEHVLLEAHPQGLFVRALSFEPPPTINNVPFTQAPLPPGAVLGVGATQIYVEATEGQGQGQSAEKKKGSSKITLLAMLIMLPAAYMLFFDDEDLSGQTRQTTKAPPELWAAPITQCPHQGAQALAFARERMAVADAKRERRPFHVQDGVQAVPVYETAGACFRVGGDGASAKLAEDAAQFLRREMNDDFRTRRVRLEHSLNTQDYVSAQKEVRVLLQFVEGKQHEWVTWLQNLDRQLKLKVGASTKT
jgi:hypothetical protein